jgi:hypothetical protein
MRNKLGIYALITNLLAEQIYINNPKRLRHVMCSVRAENHITLYSNMRFNSFYRRCKILLIEEYNSINDKSLKYKEVLIEEYNSINDKPLIWSDMIVYSRRKSGL